MWYLHVLQNNFLPQLTANNASAYAVVYARWCHAAYCKFYARFEHFFWLSHHVKQLSRSAQLWKLLATYHPWPESLRLLFEGLLEGGVCTKTIHWIGDDKNACLIMQRGWGRFVLPCYCKHVVSFKRLLKGMVATSSTYWQKKKSLHRCWAVCKKLVVEKRPVHFL